MPAGNPWPHGQWNCSCSKSCPQVEGHVKLWTTVPFRAAANSAFRAAANSATTNSFILKFKEALSTILIAYAILYAYGNRYGYAMSF
jgi:hypothetical protein